MVPAAADNGLLPPQSVPRRASSTSSTMSRPISNSSPKRNSPAAARSRGRTPPCAGAPPASRSSSICAASSPRPASSVAGRRQSLDHEPVQVGVQQRVGVRHHGEREPGGTQAADHRVVVAQVGHPGVAPRVEETDRPRVAQQRLAAGDPTVGAAPRTPVAGADRGHVHLFDDVVDHAVEHVLLAGDVVVERHRLDADLPGETAHRQPRQPVTVGQRDRGDDDPLGPRQRPAWSPRAMGGASSPPRATPLRIHTA